MSDSAVAAGEHGSGTLVPQHFVPTPATISPQAQAFMCMDVPTSDLGIPELDDAAAWKAHRDAADAGIVMVSKHYADSYPSDVVTHELSGSKIYEITPRSIAVEDRNRAIYFIHGGGFMVGGGEAAIYFAMQLAGQVGCKGYSIDYRMVPEVTFPVPLDDTLEGYRFVLARHDPANVAVYGPSAGATLAAAVLLKARDLGLPMPAACALHSCPSDMVEPGDSAYANFKLDIMLQQHEPRIFDYYMGDFPDPKHPYASPVYGDFSGGFPPTLLTSGTRDLLLSNTVRLHRAMIRDGVKADLHIWEAMSHVSFFGAPEDVEFHKQHADFIRAHIGIG